MRSAAPRHARKLFIGGLLGLGIAALVPLVMRSRGATAGGAAPAEWYAFSPPSSSLPALWKVPPFALVDQHERPTSSATFAGKPYIASFIFTQCTNACPLITSRMVLLQRELRGADLRFVSFSVDPAHDTPAALAAYAARWHVDEQRWSLLATTEPRLRELVAGFHVTVEPTGDAADPIVHSEVFFLVDGAGDVRGIYQSRDSEALARLVTDARALIGASPSTSDAAPTLAGLGCLGCHDVARIAPPLNGLAGARRMLADGTAVDVDDAYLRRAILTPGADVVAGYPAIMPSYRAQLTDAQLQGVVAELLARPARSSSTKDADIQVVIDPVCKMEVRTEPDAPHVRHKGHDVYFCAEVCRDAFLVDPAAYPL